MVGSMADGDQLDVRPERADEAVEAEGAREKLRGWLNQTMKIKMTDGRTLVGTFMCTDKERNVILGNCQEFFADRDVDGRMLGLAMVPGHHIVNMFVDESSPKNSS